jgi:hypothetical protein
MTEYREIQGAAVQSLASSTGTIEGQIWYDNVNGAFKLEAFQAAAYATGGTLNTGRYAVASGGTATAGLMSGGDLFPAPVRPTAATEEYNGTAWASGGNLNTARTFVSGAGLQTAAIDVTGASSQSVELYDGSTWTNSTNLPVISDNGSTFGTQTAAIHIQGGAPGSSYPANAYEFTAGTWTSIPSLPTTNNYGAVTNGIVTAGIAIGGGATQKDTVTEYNGTAWTTTTSLPYPLYNAGGNSVGTQASTAIAGGQTPPTPTAPTNTFLFDGTSWNASASLSTGRGSPVGSAGTQSSFYIAGGQPQITATEEFTGAQVTSKSITTT